MLVDVVFFVDGDTVEVVVAFFVVVVAGLVFVLGASFFAAVFDGCFGATWALVIPANNNKAVAAIVLFHNLCLIKRFVTAKLK